MTSTLSKAQRIRPMPDLVASRILPVEAGCLMTERGPQAALTACLTADLNDINAPPLDAVSKVDQARMSIKYLVESWTVKDWTKKIPQEIRDSDDTTASRQSYIKACLSSQHCSLDNIAFFYIFLQYSKPPLHVFLLDVKGDDRCSAANISLISCRDRRQKRGEEFQFIVLLRAASGDSYNNFQVVFPS